MANKRILKLNNYEAVIKVDGTVGPVTINLATDLLADNEVLDGTPPTVNIISLLSSGLPNGIITIARNGVTVNGLSTDTISVVDLFNFGGVSDTVNNTHDIVVTTSVAECQLYIKLRKVSGYKPGVNNQ